MPLLAVVGAVVVVNAGEVVSAPVVAGSCEADNGDGADVACFVSGTGLTDCCCGALFDPAVVEALDCIAAEPVGTELPALAVDAMLVVAVALPLDDTVDGF